MVVPMVELMVALTVVLMAAHWGKLLADLKVDKKAEALVE